MIDPVNDLSDRVNIYTVLGSKSAHAVRPSLVLQANLAHRFRAELVSAVTSLLCHVIRVFCSSREKQVTRVYAFSVVALVADKHLTWVRDMDFVGKPVSRYCFLDPVPFYGKNSVASIHKAAFPLPAAAFRYFYRKKKAAFYGTELLPVSLRVSLKALAAIATRKINEFHMPDYNKQVQPGNKHFQVGRRGPRIVNMIRSGEWP